jgi:hypothetical protein
MKLLCSSNPQSFSNNRYRRNVNGFGAKIYKLHDSKGYTYNMTAYLDKDKTHANLLITATHATVTRATSRPENVGQKLYKKNFFQSSVM